MMVDIFKAVIEMSVTSTVLVLIIMILRGLGRNLLPKNALFVLWVIVIVKLLIPMTLPSPTSIYNFIVPTDKSILEQVSGTESNHSVNDTVAQSVAGGQSSPEVFYESVSDGHATPVLPDAGTSLEPKPQSPTTENSITESTRHDVEVKEAETDAWLVAGTVYITITSLLLIGIIGGYVFTALRLRHTKEVTDERALGIFSTLKGNKKVKLVVLRGNKTSMIFGVLKTRIIIPEDFKELSDTQLRHMLMHEMEHFRHGDVFWNFLMLVAMCVHWFNPILWLSFKMFRGDVETACDSRVLSRADTDERAAFAETLVYFVGRKEKASIIAPITFGKNNIKERIMAVMKFKKAGITAIIASVLIIAIVIALFATGALVPKDDSSGDNGGETQSQGDENINMINEYVDSLASRYDLNGITFTWIGSGTQAPKSDAEDGNIVNQALYDRQRDVEETFGIDIVYYSPEAVEFPTMHPVADEVLADILSGTYKYDAGYGSMGIIKSLMYEGALADVNSLEAIDLTRSWWNSSLMETAGIEGKLYFLSGDIITTNYIDANAVFINKDLAESHSLLWKDLYKEVENGTWTFDKMLESASVITAEDNGIYRYAQPDGLSVIYANGSRITHFDKNGTPYFPEEFTSDIKALSEKFSTVFADDAQTVNVKFHSVGRLEKFEEKYEGYTDKYEMFADNKVLYCFGALYDVQELRRGGVNFGILPMPKKNTDQPSYVSLADTWMSMHVFVPKADQIKQSTGVILEAMAAEGQKYLKDAYYDVLCKTEDSYDNESRMALDIITNNKVHDIADLVSGFCNCDYDVTDFLKYSIEGSVKKDFLESRYISHAQDANRQFRRLISALQDNQ